MTWRKKPLKEDLIEDKYFDDETSTQINKPNMTQSEQEAQEEIDPLDAYMQNLEKNFKNEQLQPQMKKEERLISEDPLESFMDDVKKKLIKEHNRKNNNNNINTNNATKQSNSNSEEDSETENNKNENYDFLNSDGEVDFEALRKEKKKKIEPLPAIDHTSIKYPPFNKVFYEEHEQIKALSEEQIRKLRQELEIKVKGNDPPKPIVSFAHLNFDESMLETIRKKGFEKPTAIQCQALPCLLNGRDLIGVAKTGSGKTLAYIWPLLAHILDQKALEKNEGPIGLILCPTRELTQQVYLEAKKYSKIYNISIAALLGGESKHEQWKELKAGVEILIATPGRLIDLVKKKATNFKRCTYVVLDEADKMFSMGFEYQIRSIIGQIRPDRQTCFFTATFKKKIQNLALDILTDPIIINIGKDDQANEDVQQQVIVVKNENQKLLWLVSNLQNLLSRGKVLIFLNQIKSCEELFQELRLSLSLESLVLHGDKAQYERTHIINSFKTTQNLLIATDVASRGLDVPSIKTVINYECPKDGDTHIHRVGRTGRAGNRDGVAYTLIMRHEVKFALILLKNLQISGQIIPAELEEMAMNDDGFKRNKMMAKMGLKKSNDMSKLIEKAFKRGKKNTAGLGYEEEEGTKEKEIMKNIRKEMEIQKNLQTFEIKNNDNSNNLINNNYNMGQTQMSYNENINNINENTDSKAMSRQEILSEYSNKFKNSMQFQFRNSFASAGSFQPTHNLPTITYVGKPSTHFVNEKEPQNIEKNEKKISFAHKKLEKKDIVNYYKKYERTDHDDKHYRNIKKKKSSNWDVKD